MILILIILSSCSDKTVEESHGPAGLPIRGTWKLLTGTTIENGDTSVTSYTRDLSFIKIINDSHFAFLMHGLPDGNDSLAFSAGGGPYTLKDSLYTEHLEYCSDRAWEGNDFSFIVTIKNDTLTQRGIEKVAGAGVDRMNIERYVRLDH